jgi:hypothetical protein
MAKYTVRVELHDADGDDYNVLHECMGNQGFLHYIVDEDSGEKYELPTAEYNIISEMDRDAILDKAKTAASRTGKGHMFLVSTSTDRLWGKLPVWRD